MVTPTLNSSVIALASYHRPEQENGTQLESWEQVQRRVIERQRWLWERSLGRGLNTKEESELSELSFLLNKRAVLPDGRTLWLSGLELSRQRESCMFNSAFTHVETVYDVVDLFWLLLQGCSVGYYPITGTLNGFRLPLDSIEVVRSQRAVADGAKINQETYDSDLGLWTIKVGDSAEAFAKAVGKLIAGKYPAKKLLIDLSEIRPEGCRLKGYGWLSTGDSPLASALENIAHILSQRADQLLTREDILELIQQLSAVPATKDTAQLALVDYGQAEWESLASSKQERVKKAFLFHSHPTKAEFEDLFNQILESGGREPGLINAAEASRRAPWFKGLSPSGEVLLGNKSFCTFVEVNLLAFAGDKAGLDRALYLAARMNYRQTLVSLRDEILQEAWHLNNEFLHLCGVSLTGVRGRDDLAAYDYRRMRNIAVSAAFGMAEELKTPLPKNVTCVKRHRTLTKIMGTSVWGDVPGGMHLPLGKYLFHYMSLSEQNPLVSRLRQEGYQIMDKPFESGVVLVKCPVSYTSLSFSPVRTTRNHEKLEELEINQETAVQQLNWYLKLQETWSEQNVASTIYYDPSEVPEIIEWLDQNWDKYLGVSFAFRQDALKSAAELGLPYLEEEVVSKEALQHYVAKIKQ